MAGGAFALLTRAGGIELAALARALDSPGTLVSCLLLVALTPLLGSLRWLMLLRAAEVDLPLSTCLRLTFVGLFFNAFMPGAVGGDPVKALYAARRAPAGRRVEAATTVLLDRALGLSVLMGLAAVGFVVALLRGQGAVAGALDARVASLRPILLGGLAALVALGIALGVPRVRAAVRARVLSLSGGAYVVRSLATVGAGLLRPRVVGVVVLLSLGAHLTTVLVIHRLGLLLGDVPPLAAQIYLVPLALTVNALPGPPSGVGVGELAFETLFDLALGHAGSAGAEACLLWRFLMWTWSAVGGLVLIGTPLTPDGPPPDAEAPAEADGEPAEAG